MNGEGDGDTWLTGWEQQCANSIEGQPDYEQSLTIEADNSHRKIWTVFQDSATSIAQLYRGIVLFFLYELKFYSDYLHMTFYLDMSAVFERLWFLLLQNSM